METTCGGSSMSREVMKLALEALESDPISHAGLVSRKQAITALRQARSLTDELMDCVDRLGSEADTVDPRVWQHLLVYAPKPEEEPVAWISDSPTKGNGKQLHWTKSEAWRWSSNITPLYAAPPKREWVGLTLNEAEDFYEKYTDRAELINAVDKFLEEKNHG